MNVVCTELPGVLLFEPQVFRDQRGRFLEIWREDAYREAGIPRPFVQDNVSCSRNNVLRGLHYQWPRPQGKLISVLRGEIFDVAVDIRLGSPTFGSWVGYFLSGTNARQLYVLPEGFAHGFVVTSDYALVAYRCTDYYVPLTDRCVSWNDPDLRINWPVDNPILSTKDRAAPMFGRS
nr:MAG: dTDP-4-dehydrorhamnose 3,5-epimerase [Pseudomonadota bacterium]